MGLIETVCKYQGNEVLSTRLLNVISTLKKKLEDFVLVKSKRSTAFITFFLFFLQFLKMKQIKTINNYESISNKDYILFKHSNTCGVSKRAMDEVLSFFKQTKHPVYYLVVQESRELSNFIEEKHGIKHESPQVIIFKDSLPVWNDSHFQITKQVLKEHTQ